MASHTAHSQFSSSFSGLTAHASMTQHGILLKSAQHSTAETDCLQPVQHGQGKVLACSCQAGPVALWQAGHVQPQAQYRLHERQQLVSFGSWAGRDMYRRCVAPAPELSLTRTDLRFLHHQSVGASKHEHEAAELAAGTRTARFPLVGTLQEPRGMHHHSAAASHKLASQDRCIDIATPACTGEVLAKQRDGAIVMRGCDNLP